MMVGDLASDSGEDVDAGRVVVEVAVAVSSVMEIASLKQLEVVGSPIRGFTAYSSPRRQPGST